MERGVGIAMRIEADALAMSAGMSHRAITERILRQADRAGQEGCGPALIDAGDGTVTAWPRFTQTVRGAAAGLVRRGVAEGDAVGVLVQDAASYATAVHAIRAAGARAVGIRSSGIRSCGTQSYDTADVAAQLNECGARMLITTAPLAALATEAADRSWVRQVFSFGEAEGTTPFSSLLESAGPPDPAGSPDPAGPLEPAGEPEAAAPGTASADGLTRRDVVVAAPPCGCGHRYTSLLDLALLAGATVVAASVPRIPAAVRRYRGTAAIVPEGTHVLGIPPGRVFAVPDGLTA